MNVPPIIGTVVPLHVVQLALVAIAQGIGVVAPVLANSPYSGVAAFATEKAAIRIANTQIFNSSFWSRRSTLTVRITRCLLQKRVTLVYLPLQGLVQKRFEQRARGE